MNTITIIVPGAAYYAALDPNATETEVRPVTSRRRGFGQQFIYEVEPNSREWDEMLDRLEHCVAFNRGVHPDDQNRTAARAAERVLETMMAITPDNHPKPFRPEEVNS